MYVEFFLLVRLLHVLFSNEGIIFGLWNMIFCFALSFDDRIFNGGFAAVRCQLNIIFCGDKLLCKNMF